MVGASPTLARRSEVVVVAHDSPLQPRPMCLRVEPGRPPGEVVEGGAAEVRVRQVRAGEVAHFQLYVPQVRPAKITSPEVADREPRAVQVYASPLRASYVNGDQQVARHVGQVPVAPADI